MSRPSRRWDEGLSEVARRIAGTRESPLRVLAGPGTGKTYALMRRAMRLLEEGADPASIFVCTFTRTAARDLQRELQAFDIPSSDRVQSGTIHAFCFSVLSRAAVLQITGRVPRPLLKFEERFLLADIKGNNGEGIRQLTRRLNAFAAAWARLSSDTPGWPSDPQDRQFLAVLESWLRFHQAMHIGELIPEMLRFVRDNPISLYRPRFDHVLVDEYQDLNRAEQTLLDDLASSGTLSIVGDGNQSIYSFKYAHPEGISVFGQNHPGTCDEFLTECRRCPRLIVSMANELISRNPLMEPPNLIPGPTNPQGEAIIVQWRSLQEEAEGLANFIKQKTEVADICRGRVLVLAPRRQFGYAIRDALNNIQVPAHSFFYEEALDGDPSCEPDCLVQEAFSLLTILARPRDKVALRCWSGMGSPSLRSNAWARIRRYAEENGKDPSEILEKLADHQLNLPHTADVIQRFKALKDRIRELEGLRGRALADRLFPPAEPWAEAIRGISSSFTDGDAVGLLALIQHAVTQPDMPSDVDYVRVMSLHKSKGLTADLVIVVGCIEGLIPTISSDDFTEETRRELEEQRRLFYVAITRPTKTLVISSITELPCADAFKMGARTRIRRRGRTLVPTIASRFLQELGPNRPPTIPGPNILRIETPR